MKRITRIALASILSALVVLSFASCQTSDVAATEIVVAEPAPAPAEDVPPAPVDEPAAEAPAPAETVEPVPATVPVDMEIGYLGYTLGIECYDSYAIVSYPSSVVTRGDVEAFLAAESMKYGASASGIVYSFPADGELRLDYPAGVTAAERRALAAAFATDVIDTVNEIFSVSGEPVIVTHTYEGYSLSIEISQGSAVVTYPDFVTAAEAEEFFAAINLEYGDTLGGVYYTIDGPGVAVFTYPEDIGFAEVNAFSAIFVTALIEYIG